MSTNLDLVDLFDQAASQLPDGLLGARRPTHIRGAIDSTVVSSADELARCIAGSTLRDGWAMYQSQLIVELQALPVVADADAGRLIAAEWTTAEGGSAAVRLIERGAYRVTEWRERPDGTEWLCEELTYRGIDGGQLRYLRLWPIEDLAQHDLRPAVSVFAGRVEGGSDE
ncbi:MAG: hypothetical protein RQ729_03835 [Wenzhouxiangellaceae bacterium]|nr:hypothetical protein [Wenzhouxiangellaceae bacterium]